MLAPFSDIETSKGQRYLFIWTEHNRHPHPTMKHLLLSVVVVGLTNILCQWSLKRAKSFDDNLQSLEDFNQYIKSVRKLYNRPKFAPDNTDGIFVNTFNIRGGFEVEGNPRHLMSADT